MGEVFLSGGDSGVFCGSPVGLLSIVSLVGCLGQRTFWGKTIPKKENSGNNFKTYSYLKRWQIWVKARFEMHWRRRKRSPKWSGNVFVISRRYNVRSHFVPIEDESSSLIKKLNSQGNYKVSPQPQFHGAKWQSFLLIPWIGCKSTARMSFYTPG